MSKHYVNSAILLLALGMAGLPADVLARGFGGFGGGGFHGGGFGGGGFSRGSFGGGSFGGAGLDRGASFDRGSFGGGNLDRGSFGAGSFGGANFDRGNPGGAGFDRGNIGEGSFDRGNFSEGGFRAGDFSGSVSRSQLGGFLGLPTDGGMQAAGGAAAHVYQGYGGTGMAHISAGERGAAGERYAGATAVKGPAGNTVVHTSEAGRGVAAGPGGVAAGGYAAGRTAVNGATVAGHAYGYGTRAWSPTYCRAQAISGRGWLYGRGIWGNGWWTAHPWAWYPAGYAAADWGAAIWATATWANAADWIGCAPEYYGYNYGNDIVYDNGDVYYAGQNAGTVQQYYQEAADLAGSGGTAAATVNAQWLTLGVFGLMAAGQKSPDMVFQLAVDKQGVIRGNYYDQVTQTNLPVTGQVDKKTQRVAWKVGGGKGTGSNGIVVETGLYNLTQDDSTALVHYGADKTQQDVLVRMQQPEGEESQAGGE